MVEEKGAVIGFLKECGGERDIRRDRKNFVVCFYGLSSCHYAGYSRWGNLKMVSNSHTVKFFDKESSPMASPNPTLTAWYPAIYHNLYRVHMYVHVYIR